MPDRALSLHVYGGDRLRVSFFEGRDRSLRPYEFQEAAWDQIEAAAADVFAILQRANRNGRVSPEVLDSLKKSGRLLFDLLIPPHAKAKLAGTTAETLTLTLDDTVLQLPWELLHDGRDFLCRRFALGRIASTRQAPIAHFSRSFEAPFKVLVIADPRGDLEACYREGLDIKNFLDRKRDVFRVDFKSYPVDIAFVKKNIHDYDIVHYAGHACYDVGNPAQSGWLLSDGTLKAAEIAALGGTQPMPALVFANACQSGQAGHAEIFGLANAFLLASVQHYIGTFSEIVDEPSQRFAKYFYQFIAAGDAVGPALRSARGALIEASPGQSLIWANYLLYGEPRLGFGADNIEEPEKDQTSGWRSLVPAPSERSKPLLFSLTAVLVMAAAYAGYAVFSSAPPPVVKTAPQLVIGPRAEAPASSAAIGAPLSLTMNLIGQRKEPNGSHIEVVVKEGGVLRSGDQFHVQVEVNRPCHLYVLLFDSHGEASQLFPDAKIETPGFIEAGRKIGVPGRDLWFWLDEHAGIETVYAIASETPLLDIRGLLSKMEKAGKADGVRLSGDIDQGRQIVERGVGGVGKGKAASYTQTGSAQLQRIKKVTDVVASTGAVVRAISFDHR